MCPPKSIEPPSLVPDLRTTILLIDDDEHVLTVTQRMLETCGYGVVTAGGGFEGMEAFSADPSRFGLVLLDMRMPDLGGRATLKGLRRVDPEVCAVLMSGVADEYEQCDANPAGFLQKPYDISELQGVVEAALSTPVTQLAPSSPFRS